MESKNGKIRSVLNPRTGQVDYEFTILPDAELVALCDRLRKNQVEWAASTLEHRIEVMLAWADQLEARRGAIAEAESIDTGYSKMSQMSTMIVLENIRGWCKQAPAVLKSAMRTGTTFVPTIAYETRLRPYPLLGIISSWNAPLHLSTIDFIPALLAGCAAIVKTSSITPRFVAPVMESIKAVPELAKVLSYALGDGQMGQRMVELVDIVCFTGSVENGRKVGEACSRNFIPVFLELGGKDPVIVTATADLERAASSVIRGSIGNTGQVCFAVERVYVDAKVHDKFVEILAAKAAKVEMNYPDPKKGEMGPFISMGQADIVDAQIDDAVAKGAKIVVGGKSVTLGGGRYMPATVLTNVTHDMIMMKEETFGPLMPVVKYSTEEEAIRLANDSNYGLSAAVIAGTEEEAMKIGAKLDAGTVNIQDVCLTFAKTLDVETNASKLSGIGGARTGPASILRFVRKTGFLINKGGAMTGAL
jgi:succinate-semialdehyde dehydrogenase / glutarate-semialdehyde dehydrogenase